MDWRFCPTPNVVRYNILFYFSQQLGDFDVGCFEYIGELGFNDQR